MKLWQRILALIQRPRILRRKQNEQDLEDELRFDLVQEAELRIQRGEPPESARASAHRDFGNLMLVKEATRNMWGWTSLERLAQDTRFAWRMLKRNPILTLVAIASLAIGIGANTAIFSLVDTILLKSLAVRDPDQLRLVLWTGKPRIPQHTGSGYTTTLHGIEVSSSFSYPMYKLLAASVPQFSDLMGFTHSEVTVVAAGESHYASAMFVTGNFFRGLGVNPILGRMLSPDDDRAAAPGVAVISYAYWERRFGLDPTVVGQGVTINGWPVSIAGVVPPSFLGEVPGQSRDFFLPIVHVSAFGPTAYALAKEDHWWVQIMGRLRTGVSDRQVRAALDVVMDRAGASYPQNPAHKRDPWRAVLEAGAGGVPLVREQAAGPLFILSSVVALVLLISCANIANLLLARGAARRREIAVRLSIGAGRGQRVLRQLLTESLLLAGLGAAIGLTFASPLARAILTMTTRNEPLNFDVHVDLRTLLFTAAITLVTAVIFGLAPAFRATCVDLTPALKDGPAGAAGMARQLRLSRLLVISQVALSTLLLAGAGLFVRTLINLTTMDPGFDPRQLLIFTVDGSRSGYQGRKLLDLYEQIRAAIGAIPGVQAVTLSDVPLIGDSMSNSDIRVPGYIPKAGEFAKTYQMAVGGDFLTTMGIPILLGRDLDDHERPSGPYVAVVNEKFARSYFAGRNPIGRIFYFGQSPTPAAEDTIQIVGVCKNAKYDNLKHEIPPTAYLSYLQNSGPGGMTFEIRTALPPMAIASSVRRAVAGVDRNVPVAAMRTQEEQIRLSLSMECAFAALVGSFGSIAAVLAAIGLYGVMAYAVTRRTAEIGIRMALGAVRGDVQWMVLRESLVMVVIGITMGIPAALALTRLVRQAFYGIEPNDPASFVAAGALMLSVGTLAAWIPALRAARLDPMHALRHE